MMRGKGFIGFLSPLALVLVVAGLVGCGGGGGGASTPAQPGNGGAGTISHAGSVTVLPPKASNMRVWIVYQDGDGPWKQVQPNAGSYSFQVDNVDGRYAVMVVADKPSDVATVNALYLTRNEAAVVDLSASEDYLNLRHQVSPNVLNASGSARCHVRIWGSTGAETCSDWQADHHWFEVSDASFDASLTRFDSADVADLFIYQRDLKTSSDMPLSFDLAKATPLAATQRIGLAADAVRPGETLTYSVTWWSAQGSVALNRSSTSGAYPTLPTNGALPSGYYTAAVMAISKQGENSTRRQGGYRSIDGAGQTVPLPPSVNPVAFGLVPNSAYPRPLVKWSPLSGSLLSTVDAYVVSNPDPDGMDPVWHFSFSAGWSKGAKAQEYSFPDLGGLGWNPRWYFQPGKHLLVNYSEQSDSAPEPNWFTGAARTKPAGSTFWWSRVSTKFTLPR